MDGAITVAGTLTGSLSNTQGLSGSLSSVGSLGGEITLGSGSYYPEYEGSYTVTPTLNASQTLSTNGTVMTDNVTVHQIPVTRTTNPEGGWTVLIG